MDRRNFIGSALGLAAASTLSDLAAGKKAFGAGGKGLDGLTLAGNEVLKQLSVVQEKATACASAGRSCIQHCLEELSQGHQEFAHCAQTAQHMVPLCEVVTTLAAYKASVLKLVLDSCIAACDHCITACKEHEPHFAHGMHLPCKACMQSCQECKAECEKLKKML